jgi:hypothetical protein
MFNVKPFPEGTEREAINERFDELFGAIQTEETDKGVRMFSSPSRIDTPAVAAYLASNGTPDSAIKAESERISQALAPNRPGRVAEDGSTYSQGDFFAPEQPKAPSQGQQIADAASRALARSKARPGRDSLSDDLIRGMSGDWAALAREVDARGNASSILADLINREIPVWNVNGTILNDPEAVHAVMLPIRSPYFESLKVMVLDGNLKAVHSQILTVGSVSESSAHPAEIFGTLARLREIHGKKYTTLVFSHNHPSGDPSPSRADEQVTRRINAVAEMAGWSVLDHVITNGEKYFSFAESGIMGGTTVNESPFTPRKNKGTYVPSITQEDRQAPWEAVKRSALKPVDTPERRAGLAQHLRNANPDAAHILYTTTRGHLLAVERVDMVEVLDKGKLSRRLMAARGREGAFGFIIDYPFGKVSDSILVNRVSDVAQMLQMRFWDAVAMTSPTGAYVSAHEGGLVQETPMFSSPTPNPALRQLLTSDLSNPPSQYEYKAANPQNETVRLILDQFRLPARMPSEPQRAIQEFEQRTGTTVQFYESKDTNQGGFTLNLVPSVIFINSSYDAASIASILAHEAVHVAQKDSKVDTAVLYREIMDLLSNEEIRKISERLKEFGYTPAQLRVEIPAFLMAEAVGDAGLIGFKSLRNADGIETVPSRFLRLHAGSFS